MPHANTNVVSASPTEFVIPTRLNELTGKTVPKLTPNTVRQFLAKVRATKNAEMRVALIDHILEQIPEGKRGRGASAYDPSMLQGVIDELYTAKIIHGGTKPRAALNLIGAEYGKKYLFAHPGTEFKTLSPTAIVEAQQAGRIQCAIVLAPTAQADHAVNGVA